MNEISNMMGIPAGTPEGFLTNLVVSVLSNPDAMAGLEQFLCPHHNAVDVAQDALDAYEHGQLTKSQASRIIQICLQEDGESPQDLAMQALQLWRDGTWTKERAMRVVRAALDEFKEHPEAYSQTAPFSRTALPPSVKQTDAELLEQLFSL
ncbi:MAG: hypothetical protein AAGA60_30260 [Cyanobacteria bacterium P01_E01_bin.42]